ncbi:MAG: NAD(P)H-hydrate dehydratase [Candidatus ainarchaeum sp.]|nr:NAD(P)H-hydrate dehydratase [Candidatus ainarchaeum sp.]
MEKLFVPKKRSHKGENGRLLIIGGSRQYHGAPVLSLLAARRFVDLAYFYPGDKDRNLMNAVKRVPEVIVVRGLGNLAKMDCVLFGVGLGRARFSLVRLRKAKKLVIDGDGLKRVRGRIPKNAILTPHEGEFRMLFGMHGTRANVRAMAAKHRCIILKKGPEDIISDGRRTVINKIHNQGMTKGGTGDVLSGLVAALACKNGSFTAAIAGARINGHAGNMLKKSYGYNFSASDLANRLAESCEKLYGK